MKLTPDLEWIDIEYATKPWELANLGPDYSKLPVAAASAAETARRLHEVPPLIDRAIRFGKRHRVEAAWAVLEGQTMVRMALAVARGLSVPLYSFVFDPLTWWLSAHGVDPENSNLVLRQFEDTLRHSEACAVASQPMAEEYQRKYGVPCIPVISSHDRALGATPPLACRTSSELVIGMAGQFYANQEWAQLVSALGVAGWRVDERVARLKVLGHYVPDAPIPPGHLEFLGWKSQPEAIRILSTEADVLYCPYPFDFTMKEVAQFSLPSKLPLYFAAGRPVVFHGPAYSAPARYLAKRNAGVICADRDGNEVVRVLSRMAADHRFYARMARNSQTAFRTDFTTETMKSNFFAFLGNEAIKR
jgi:hypothetical protein